MRAIKKSHIFETKKPNPVVPIAIRNEVQARAKRLKTKGMATIA
jgi:hypothetical protein